MSKSVSVEARMMVLRMGSTFLVHDRYQILGCLASTKFKMAINR